MSFDPNYAWQVLPSILNGAVTTIWVTLASFAIGLVLGLLLALARLSPYRLLSLAAAGFGDLLRGTPLLVQVFFVFYILPLYGIVTSPIPTGVAALGIYFSAYLAEVYIAGFQSVPRGQWEATIALNLSPAETWLRIILPQALPPIIPALGNYLIDMFKATPILAVITVPEMLNVALADAYNSFRYLEPLTIVGAVFFFVSYPSSRLIRRIEKRVNLQ